ncbi:hypothetical protein ACWC0A_30695 [Streptomyces scopuliridis]
MSAWAEVVNHDGSDEWLELCSQALAEVQRETSRRNAERIRSGWDEVRGATSATKVMNFAADLIDPGSET